MFTKKPKIYKLLVPGVYEDTRFIHVLVHIYHLSTVARGNAMGSPPISTLSMAWESCLRALQGLWVGPKTIFYCQASALEVMQCKVYL